MRYLFLFFLPLFIFSKPFKVATYNVENLFDAEYIGTEYDDYRKKHNWTQRMVEIKLNHVAEVICDLDADILGLQEIENSNILKQLKTKLSRVGCGYRYSAISSKKNAPIQVALLSRFPIKKQKELQVSYSPLVRNILEVEIDVHGESLWIFVNHWKSRAYHGVESKRLKYAKVLKKRLDSLSESKPYIVLGDFNTDYDAHLSLEKKINDTNGRTGLHDILNTAKNGRLVTESDMIQDLSGYHYTLWKELALDQRWNTKFYGKKGTADHIILPPTLFDKKGIEYVNNSFKVFRKSYLFTKRGYINRWQYKKGKHRGKGYSDHLPLYAYFDKKPYIAGADKIAVQTKNVTKNIEYFYTIETLENEVRLNDAVVIWKHKRNAIIKQSKEGRGIFLFGSAGDMEVGKRYDLRVRAIKTYKGLKELTQVYVFKEKGEEDISPYLLQHTDLLKKISYRQNEVFIDLVGIYKKRHFYVEGRKTPIYFKNKKSTLPNGAKLKIHNALLGYYKKLQLVVYRTKDFTILEK
ncbi:endonuclease/exonuclease/phosphatase family protein [Sulfurovum sp.]|uniref:endonuclease/exonuclease/phosphatase family protein n=1 Tax=Sulfurovum sp. TaxID=1969726 RepID=UPI002868368F|nr:endonuclease/exonuclease/phosphatase family protein [Sulfurovum sp.]